MIFPKCNRTIFTQKESLKHSVISRSFSHRTQLESEDISTDHDCDVMSVAERQRAITVHQILLYPHEAFKILCMVTHHLEHTLQTIVLQEDVH